MNRSNWQYEIIWTITTLLSHSLGLFVSNPQLSLSITLHLLDPVHRWMGLKYWAINFRLSSFVFIVLFFSPSIHPLSLYFKSRTGHTEKVNEVANLKSFMSAIFWFFVIMLYFCLFIVCLNLRYVSCIMYLSFFSCVML